MSSSLRPWELRGREPPTDASRAMDNPLELPADRLSLADLEAAVKDAEAAGKVDSEGRLVWGVALMADARFGEALDCFQPVLDSPEAPGRTHLLAAVAAQSAGRSPSSEALEKVFAQLAASPERDVAPLWMTAGSLLIEAGLFDRAGAAFDRAASAYSKASDSAGMVWALREAVQTAALQGRFEEASALLKRARRFSPNEEMSLLLRLDEARLAALGGRWPEAITGLEAALALAEKTLTADHPLLDHTLVSLAAARMETEDGASEQTERLLDRALGIRSARNTDPAAPETVEVLLLLGEHHRLSGRLEDALPLLGRAATAREANGEGPKPLAHAYLVWSRALEQHGLSSAAREKHARAQRLMSATT